MAKAGKKYQDAVKLLETGKVYTVEEAIELVKKTATAKFDETIELHVRLGVDPKYADQQVRGAMVLPHGTGKSKRVLVFAKGAKVDEAEAAGADFVGSDEIVPWMLPRQSLIRRLVRLSTVPIRLVMYIALSARLLSMQRSWLLTLTH